MNTVSLFHCCLWTTDSLPAKVYISWAEQKQWLWRRMLTGGWRIGLYPVVPFHSAVWISPWLSLCTKLVFGWTNMQNPIVPLVCFLQVPPARPPLTTGWSGWPGAVRGAAWCRGDLHLRVPFRSQSLLSCQCLERTPPERQKQVGFWSSVLKKTLLCVSCGVAVVENGLFVLAETFVSCEMIYILDIHQQQ